VGTSVLPELLTWCLQAKTRPIMDQARKALAEDKGEAALEPHNMSQAMAGEQHDIQSMRAASWCWALCSQIAGWLNVVSSEVMVAWLSSPFP